MDLSKGTANSVTDDPNIIQNELPTEEKHDENPSTNLRKRKFDEDEQPYKKAHIEGIGAVVAAHYNNIEEKGLAHRNKSTIFFMRNFNNWIKSILIDHFVSRTRGNNYGDFSVLDLGCGKGGDIFKWKKNFVKHVIFTDIAESSLAQCQERYNSTRNSDRNLFSAEFIVADFTKTRLRDHFRDTARKVDLVSCQFAFHYAFESLSQAEQAILNISENLHSGGHFVATLPNAYRIMAGSQRNASDCDERNSSCNRNDFGNNVFKISFNKDISQSERPLFGDKYHFSLEGVVDCPEFLVHLPTLVSICKKYDLECVFIKEFDEIFNKYKGEKNYLQLLRRMNCLEQYPKPNAEQDSREYKCAERHLARNNVRSIWTLSASEWEATCLYYAVGFRKK